MYNKSLAHRTAIPGAKGNTEVSDVRPTDKADLGHQASGGGQVLTRMLDRQYPDIDLSLSARSDVIFRDMKHRICVLGVVD